VVSSHDDPYRDTAARLHESTDGRLAGAPL